MLTDNAIALVQQQLASYVMILFKTPGCRSESYFTLIRTIHNYLEVALLSK